MGSRRAQSFHRGALHSADRQTRPRDAQTSVCRGAIQRHGEIATQLTGVPPNDPTLGPYFALAEERDLPVLIHTPGIGPYLPGFRSAMGSPLLLEEVLVRHPKLRLFVENAGIPIGTK